MQSRKKAYSNALDLAHKLGYKGETREDLLEFLTRADIDDLVNATNTVDYVITLD